MIQALFKLITDITKVAFSRVKSRIVINCIVIIIGIATALFFYSFIYRYINYNNAINDIKAKNYTLATSILDEQQPFFSISEWISYYNKGILEFKNANYNEALNNFNEAKNILQNTGDNENMCRTEFNEVTTNEEIAKQIIKNNDKDPDFIRSAAKIFLDSFIARNQIDYQCSDLLNSMQANTQTFKEINELKIDEDHLQYNLLIKDAYAIDGKLVDNEIDSQVSILNSNQNEKIIDPKINELLKSNAKSEQDSQKAKDIIKDKSENKIIKPW